MLATTAKTWEAVKAARAEAWLTIDRIVEDADGLIERWEAVKLSRPVEGAGEWDWYWQLSKPERSRIAQRWTSEFGQDPDLVADRAGLDVDAAMAEWVRATRIVDAASSLRIRKYHGYVPGTASLGGHGIDRLFPTTGYVLESLFAAQPACTDYMADLLAEGADDEELDAEWTEEDALRYMEEALS